MNTNENLPDENFTPASCQTNVIGSSSLFPDNFSGAEISDCGKYRWKLWRIWDDSKPKILWIMHNPSTADAEKDDPTIRRIINFSKSWGFGGLYVGNVCPYRSTNPKDLIGSPIEKLCPLENIKHTKEMKSKCSEFILAYGNVVIKGCEPTFFDEDWKVLKLTKDGNPCHPLYLKSDLKPLAFQNCR